MKMRAVGQIELRDTGNYYAGQSDSTFSLAWIAYPVLLTFAVFSYWHPLWIPTVRLFWIITGLLAFHNVTEFAVLYKRNAKLFLFRPVVVCAIVVFFLQHGALTNFLYRGLDGQFHKPYNEILVSEPYWLTKTMALVLASSVMYWIGYKLSLGTKLGRIYFNIFKPFWNFRVSHYALLIGLVVGFIVKFILNSYNALGHRFGYVLQQSEEIPSIIYRLKLFENLLLIFVICFLYLAIQHKRNKFYWSIVVIGITTEVIFALTTGARSTLVFVFLAVFLIDYFHHGGLRWIWVISGGVLLILTFTLLQDFKTFALREGRQAAAIKDPFLFIQTANNYRAQINKASNINEAEKHAGYLTAVGRFNYVNEATQVIRHKEVNGLTPRDPDFLGPFFTFPFFAVVPQFYILGKSIEGYGAWATELLLNTRKYDIAISPVGYSFLAGGPTLVLIVFFVFGMLAKTLEYLFSKVETLAAFMIFLTLFRYLILFDTVVWAVWLNMIRYCILLPPMLWLVFRKWNPK